MIGGTLSVTKDSTFGDLAEGESRKIMELKGRLHLKEVDALWGAGPRIGYLAIFGRPVKYQGRDVAEFGTALVSSVPFPYRNDQRDVDFKQATSELNVPLVDLDPRRLEASQYGLRRAALLHYLKDTYDITGQLFDRGRNESNDWPVVFEDSVSQRLIILQGHHRSTAALIGGRFVRARLIQGKFKELTAR